MNNPKKVRQSKGDRGRGLGSPKAKSARTKEESHSAPESPSRGTSPAQVQPATVLGRRGGRYRPSEAPNGNERARRAVPPIRSESGPRPGQRSRRQNGS